MLHWHFDEPSECVVDERVENFIYEDLTMWRVIEVQTAARAQADLDWKVRYRFEFVIDVKLRHHGQEAEEVREVGERGNDPRIPACGTR